MGRYLDIAKSVETTVRGYEKNELNEITPGANPDSMAEAIREHIEERAAIQEYDGGLPRQEAERQAREACKVFEYRLSDSPFRWLVAIMPGCTLDEARGHLHYQFGAQRVLQVRAFILGAIK